MYVGPRWLIFFAIWNTTPRAVLATESSGGAVLLRFNLFVTKSQGIVWQGKLSSLTYSRGMTFCRLLIDDTPTPYFVPRGPSRKTFERIVKEKW
jgi:hypothetical protein